MANLLPITLAPAPEDKDYFAENDVKLRRIQLTGGSEMLGLRIKSYKKGTLERIPSLEQFYADMTDTVFNIDLGLYYLAYVKDLCDESAIVVRLQM